MNKNLQLIQTLDSLSCLTFSANRDIWRTATDNPATETESYDFISSIKEPNNL